MAGAFLGTVPQWIAAFSSTGVFGVVGTLWLKSRKITIAEKQDDRQGFGSLIDRLNSDIDKLKRINIKLYNKSIRCDANFAAMKLRFGELHFVLRLMLPELERLSSDSLVLAHARELIATVYPSEEPIEPDEELDALVRELPR